MEDIDNCIVAIGPRDGTTPSGVGCLISRHHVLTCAHVVNVSANKDKHSQEKPGEMVKVVFFADHGKTPLLANIDKEDHWKPPLPNGEPTSSADFAILTLDGAAPAQAVVAPMRERYPLQDLPFSVTGFPDSWTSQ